MTRSNAQEEFSPDKHRLPAGRQSLRAAVLIAVLVGFALRLYRLDFQELGELEGVVYGLRDYSFSQLVQIALNSEEFLLLPASFWLQNVWLIITGPSEFAIRSISAFCSIIAVPLTYRIAADIRIGAFAALAATLLAAANTYAIWHTQTVLYHSLGLALTTASILLALRIIGGVGGRKTLVAYVICTASTFYTHAFAALPLLAQNLYLLFVLARDRRGGGSASAPGPAGSLPVRWTVSQIALGILCIPWLVSAWPSITEITTRTLSSPWVYEFLGYIGILAIGHSVPTPAWKLGAGLFAVPLIVAAILGIFLAERWMPDREKKAVNGWVGPEGRTPAPEFRPNSSLTAKFSCRNAHCMELWFFLSCVLLELYCLGPDSHPAFAGDRAGKYRQLCREPPWPEMEDLDWRYERQRPTGHEQDRHRKHDGSDTYPRSFRRQSVQLSQLPL